MKENEKVINFRLMSTKLAHYIKKVRGVFYSIIFALSLILINRYFLDSGVIDNELVIAYLEVLKWLLLLMLGAFIVYKYFPELATRVKKAPGGLEFYPELQDSEGAEELAQELSSPRSSHNNRPVDITTPEGRADVLEDPNVKWLLEKIYRNIFGTQIDVLYKLTSFPDGLNANDLLDIYTKHRELMPDHHHRTFADFIAYLTNSNLLAYDSTTKLCTLTDLGRLFLDYLILEGILNTYKNY